MVNVFIAALTALCASAAPAFATITLTAEPPPTPTTLQWRVDLGRAHENPFDPDQVAVDARFTGPGGRQLTVPAFWMDAGDAKAFRVRFAPPVAGAWTMSVTAVDAQGTTATEPVAFVAERASTRGFVRRSTRNPRYFQFDNGDPYFLIGLNIAWGERRSFDSYKRWIPKLAAAGGNFARIWMSDPSVMTETREAGLGRYDQAACEFYDRLLALAEDNGVYCMVTFNNYRDLRERDEWGPCPWPLLPYASQNGGPATRPADFINDPRCQKLYRQRLRYIAARYGAYSSVMCWEFFNEQSYSGVQIPPSWTIDMTRYLKSVDAYGHLVSTSFGSNAQAEVWRAPQIDLTQTHYYGDDQTADCTPIIRASALEHRAFNKPYLMAEIGIWAQGSDAKFDTKGVGTNLHNGLWSALMSGSAGTAANWWWDSYVDPNDLWSAYSGIAAFSGAINLVERDFTPIAVPAAVYRQPASPETFADSELNAAGSWGKSHGQTIVVEPNGRSERALAKYIFGTNHPNLQTPTVIDATFAPGGGELVLKVGQVSDAAILRVLIDDEPTRDFLVSALPRGEHVTSTTRATRDERDDAHRIYQAKVDATFKVPVPEGRHRIELRNLGNDWLALSSATLRNTRSSRYAELEVLAMTDAQSGDVLAWLHDPDSNWRADATGREPRIVAPAVVRLPVAMAEGTPVALQWWNTRTGKVESTTSGRVTGGMLELETPPITRDVALIARRDPAAAAR